MHIKSIFKAMTEVIKKEMFWYGAFMVTTAVQIAAYLKGDQGPKVIGFWVLVAYILTWLFKDDIQKRFSPFRKDEKG